MKVQTEFKGKSWAFLCGVAYQLFSSQQEDVSKLIQQWKEGYLDKMNPKPTGC